MSKENKEIKEEFEAINERFEKQEDKTKELKEQLAKVQIMASAKAVIVPEGKGVFWTNKVEVLERRVDQVEETHRDELGRHIDLITELFEDKKRLESVLKDSQKEFYEIITLIAKDEWDSETSGKLRIHRDNTKRIFKRLSGEKESGNLKSAENRRYSKNSADSKLESKWLCDICVFGDEESYYKSGWCNIGGLPFKSLDSPIKKCVGFKLKPKENDNKYKLTDELLFVCVGGCGDFKPSVMKDAKDPDDPTIVCPKCGCCMWYLTPKERDSRYKNNKKGEIH